MDLEGLKKRKAELDEAYYKRGESLVSDEEYDVLKRQIELLGGEQSIGSAQLADGFKKVTRKKPMLSLANVFTEEEFKAWCEGIRRRVGHVEYIFEPKLDGLAMEVVYENGALVSAATRGDGTTGEDVTLNALGVKGIPKFLDNYMGTGRVVIRGEVVAFKKDFEEHNRTAEERGERVFVSPRSMAVGSLKQKDPAVTARRNLTFVAYGMEGVLGNGFAAQRSVEAMGFIIPETRIAYTTEYMLEYNLVELYNYFSGIREELPYEADGVVIKVSDGRLRDQLGASGAYPNWAVAWKFKAQRAVTTLRDVEWRVGRTGKVVPRATFDPVFVAGATLTHASLHSLEIVSKLEKEAGYPIHEGCQITVERSGDVIPYVSSLVKHGMPSEKELVLFKPPVKCPQCDEELKVLESGELRCENPECNHWEKMFHFMRTVFGMKGVGESIIPALENAGVEKFADIFNVQKHHVTQVDGLGESAWRIFHENVEIVRSEGIPFDVFLRALGIRGVGHRMSTAIAKKFVDIEALLGAEDNPEEVAEAVEGVGVGTATRILASAGQPYRELREVGVKVNTVEQMEESLPLSGKTVCFTGKLSMPRKRFEEIITMLGGTPVSSVSSKLNILVLGENPGSKLQKAEKLAIEIKDEGWVNDLFARELAK